MTARPVGCSAWLGVCGSSGEDPEGKKESGLPPVLVSNVVGDPVADAVPRPINERALLEEPWVAGMPHGGLKEIAVGDNKKIKVWCGWHCPVTEDGEHILSSEDKKIPIRAFGGDSVGTAAQEPYGGNPVFGGSEAFDVAMNLIGNSRAGWKMRCWVVEHYDFAMLQARGLSFVNEHGEERIALVGLWRAPANPAQMAAWFRELAVQCENIEKENA